MILACHILRSSVGLAKMQVTGHGRGFRHLQHQRAVVDTDRMGPVALAVQNPDIPVVEVDVRGAQRQGLSEPQTGAVNGESATAQGVDGAGRG